MSCQSRINDLHFRGSVGLGKAPYFLNKCLEFQKDPLIFSSHLLTCRGPGVLTHVISDTFFYCHFLLLVSVVPTTITACGCSTNHHSMRFAQCVGMCCRMSQNVTLEFEIGLCFSWSRCRISCCRHLFLSSSLLVVIIHFLFFCIRVRVSALYKR